jgi:hypothetical protein
MTSPEVKSNNYQYQTCLMVIHKLRIAQVFSRNHVVCSERSFRSYILRNSLRTKEKPIPTGIGTFEVINLRIRVCTLIGKLLIILKPHGIGHLMR